MIRFGVFHGQAFSGSLDYRDDMEYWPSLKDAERALKARYDSGWDAEHRMVFDNEGCARLNPDGRKSYRFITGDRENVYIDIYWGSRLNSLGSYAVSDYPYMRLSLGPRGGIIRESF